MQCWQPQTLDDVATAGKEHADPQQQQWQQPSAAASAAHSTSSMQQLTAQPDVQTHVAAFCSPVEAWQHSKLTLGFSGGGFLLPYHLGVFHNLAKMGIVSSSTPMAGSSAGSLVVGGIKSGLTLQQQMDSFLEAAHACRQGGVNGRLRSVLKAQLLRTLPADAAERCSDGSCWISVTQVFPRPANKLYGAFSSRQQLVKALLASCHLPRVSDGGLFTSYKSVHKRVFDGGFSNLCPVPPVPHSVSHSSSTIPTHHSAEAMPTGATAPTAAAVPGHQHSGASSAGAEPRPTAPAAALLLQRIDSTKGITTKLLPTKPKVKPPASISHSSSTVGPASATNGSSSSAVYRRTLSAPADRSAVAGRPGQQGLHVGQRSPSTTDCSSSDHTKTDGQLLSQQQHLRQQGQEQQQQQQAGHAHRGVKLHQHHQLQQQQQQQQQPGVWARRRHQQQAEQQLAASCDVQGPGAYVAAQGWFAIRVCVLPSRHMHEFPAMFRAPSVDEVAIALDKFQEWPHDLNATTTLALYPQDDDFLWDLLNRGQQDAATWAKQQGFPAEVLDRLAADATAEPPELRVVRTSSSSSGNYQHEQKQQQRAEGNEEAGLTVVAAAQGMQEVQQAIEVQRSAS